MSTHDAPRNVPRPIGWHGLARNTLPVMAGFPIRAWHATNHMVGERRKLVFSDSSNLQSLRSGQSGTKDLWHGRFHSGHGAKEIVAEFGLAPMGSSGSDGQTYLTVAGTDTEVIHQSPTGLSDIANGFSYRKIRHSINSNTAIEWSCKVEDYARPFSLSIWEVGDAPVDTADGAIDPGIGLYSPITDDQHSDIYQAHWNLWKHNAAFAHWWSKDTDTPQSLTSNVYTNVWDLTTTGNPATTAPGFYIHSLYHDRVNHDVDYVFAVKGAMQSGVPTGSAQIVDTSGTTIAEITGIDTTDQWWTTTFTRAAANSQFVAVQIKAPVIGTLDVDAVSIYEYLA